MAYVEYSTYSGSSTQSVASASWTGWAGAAPPLATNLIVFGDATNGWYAAGKKYSNTYYRASLNDLFDIQSWSPNFGSHPSDCLYGINAFGTDGESPYTISNVGGTDGKYYLIKLYSDGRVAENLTPVTGAASTGLWWSPGTTYGAAKFDIFGVDPVRELTFIASSSSVLSVAQFSSTTSAKSIAATCSGFSNLSSSAGSWCVWNKDLQNLYVFDYGASAMYYLHFPTTSAATSFPSSNTSENGWRIMSLPSTSYYPKHGGGITVQNSVPVYTTFTAYAATPGTAPSGWQFHNFLLDYGLVDHISLTVPPILAGQGSIGTVFTANEAGGAVPSVLVNIYPVAQVSAGGNITESIVASSFNNQMAAATSIFGNGQISGLTLASASPPTAASGAISSGDYTYDSYRGLISFNSPGVASGMGISASYTYTSASYTNYSGQDFTIAPTAVVTNASGYANFYMTASFNLAGLVMGVRAVATQ